MNRTFIPDDKLEHKFMHATEDRVSNSFSIILSNSSILYYKLIICQQELMEIDVEDSVEQQTSEPEEPKNKVLEHVPFKYSMFYRNNSLN